MGKSVVVLKCRLFFQAMVAINNNFFCQVCINDELVINGFATNFFDTVQNSGISPGKAAKLQALTDEFQKQGSEVIKNLKEYINHGKFTCSEQSSNSTDEEPLDYQKNSHSFLSSGESPVNVLRRQVSGSYGVESGTLSEPSARIPNSASHLASSQRFSPQASSGLTIGGESQYSRADNFSSDENSGRVRFLSSRLPATGSGSIKGYSIPSKSPVTGNLKPILKKRSPHSVSHQYSGSSSEPEDSLQRKRVQLEKNSSGYSYGETPLLDSYDSNTSSVDTTRQEPVSSSVISVDALFSSQRDNLCASLQTANFTHSPEVILPSINSDSEQPQVKRISHQLRSLAESLRSDTGEWDRQLQDSSTGYNRVSEPSTPSSNDTAQHQEYESLPQRYQPSPSQSTVYREKQAFADRTSPLNANFSPNSNSSIKSPLPSERFISSQSPISPVDPTSGRKITFSDGVIVQTEGAPAPRPVFSLEQTPYACYARSLSIHNKSPDMFQAHVWPALRRGRDVVGVCSAVNEQQIFAYIVPIIYQLLEEQQMYADLPSGSGVSEIISVKLSSPSLSKTKATAVVIKHCLPSVDKLLISYHFYFFANRAKIFDKYFFLSVAASYLVCKWHQCVSSYRTPYFWPR